MKEMEVGTWQWWIEGWKCRGICWGYLGFFGKCRNGMGIKGREYMEDV